MSKQKRLHSKARKEKIERKKEKLISEEAQEEKKSEKTNKCLLFHGLVARDLCGFHPPKSTPISRTNMPFQGNLTVFPLFIIRKTPSKDKAILVLISFWNCSTHSVP